MGLTVDLIFQKRLTVGLIVLATACFLFSPRSTKTDLTRLAFHRITKVMASVKVSEKVLKTKVGARIGLNRTSGMFSSKKVAPSEVDRWVGRRRVGK